MKLESLKSPKFLPLSKSNMADLRGGGRDTEAGSKTMYRKDLNAPTTPGQTNWVHRMSDYTRSWTSDAISDSGEICYWGETYGWVDVK